jgi:type VI secretion system protein ImpE
LPPVFVSGNITIDSYPTLPASDFFTVIDEPTLAASGTSDTMDAKQAFDAGDLQGAIDAQIQVVKATPADTRARTFLFELYSFAGLWDKADKQLEVLGVQKAQAAWGVSVYQNIVAAEQTRVKVFRDAAKPETFIDPPPFLQLHLDAIAKLRLGDEAAAMQLLEQSAAQQAEVKGEINGTAVTGLKNADELIAPFLEVIMMKDYVWVPWQQVKSLSIMPPNAPRDLIWAAAKLTLTDGVQRSCYLPTLYVNSSQSEKNDAKLGRLTDWATTENGPVRGVGQHLLVAGDADFGLLDVRMFTST